MADENFSAANLPDMFKLDKPWDIIKEYPEMAWKLIKELHDENEALKADKAKCMRIIDNLLVGIEGVLKED